MIHIPPPLNVTTILFSFLCTRANEQRCQKLSFQNSPQKFSTVIGWLTSFLPATKQPRLNKLSCYTVTQLRLFSPGKGHRTTATPFSSSSSVNTSAGWSTHSSNNLNALPPFTPRYLQGFTVYPPRKKGSRLGCAKRYLTRFSRVSDLRWR